MQKTRVVVAMSGGVDSCVAAAMLKEQGYEVIGITMQLWNHAEGDLGSEQRFDSCCSLSDVHDARRAADKLGIPHYVVNYEREFRRGVVDYFAKEYSLGRTPNPCVMCNSKLKFDHLVERARALGADWVATGHYAQVEHLPGGSVLRRGLDPRKDQSYFLFDVRPDYLAKALFPLGGLSKPEVRAKAEALGLHVAQKHESQEICFVSGKRYTDFLEQHYPKTTADKKGAIVDRSGKVLGQHDGIYKFTVGQRKGLGDSIGHAAKYVLAIDAATNRVIVDDIEHLASQSLVIENCNWLVDPQALTDESEGLAIMLRYHAPLMACRIERLDNTQTTYAVLLAEPARWVTPGQAAVLYQGDRVVGGGFIANPKLQDIGIGARDSQRSLAD